ncbi:MAG: SDR family oxidoreductase [Verrucomicrobia bacterium]|nr:SDR family oxidoreductase [Verrucomicrobiota bacterium]
MSKILVTGATGFIGKRLVYELLNQGHEIYALVRIRGAKNSLPSHPRLHLLFGDLRDFTQMDLFPSDIDAAYFLVHSMGDVVENLLSSEQAICSNFLAALEKTSCKHIIYLGGIVENATELSPHLESRLAVEKVLSDGKIPATILRASIIIGSGSASFEIIRDLVEKLPFMIAPKWVKNYCQPIAIRDVLFYLSAVLLKPECFHQTYDIGGPQPLTFKEVLLRYARFRKLKRVILDVPVFTPRLSSYWLVLITSVKFSICRHLVESMKYSTRKLNSKIDHLVPHRCLSYEEALELAFTKLAENAVVSTWMDSWDLKRINPQLEDLLTVPEQGCLIDKREVPILISLENVRQRIWRIGGDQGWYTMNWAWEVRGFLDKLLGGIGLNRGRKHPTEIQAGDSIDFWRVLLADPQKNHLILYAQMKLPGEAWLEFKIDDGKRILIQTATFRPRGLLGRIYWYTLYPIHVFIFRRMAKNIAQKVEYSRV